MSVIAAVTFWLAQGNHSGSALLLIEQWRALTATRMLVGRFIASALFAIAATPIFRSRELGYLGRGFVLVAVARMVSRIRMGQMP
jgi:hypothetical protein